MFGGIFMEKYIINEKTLAIIPIDGRSKIVEDYITYMIDDSPFNILNNSCKYYGSSFEGRVSASDFLIGVKYKCPIIISETKKIIFFPTSSYRQKECIWLNYEAISKYYVNKNNNLIVELHNNLKIELNLSARIFNNQLLKSSRLDSILKSKKR